jgi:hypothetical protein
MMTPEKILEIKQHAEAIAAILYEQTEAEQVSTLAGIEKTVRDQVLEYVTPEIAIFLSGRQQEQKQGEPDTSKVSWENCP